MIWRSNLPFTQSGRPGVSHSLNWPSRRRVGGGSSDSTGSPWCGAVGVHQTNHGADFRSNPSITPRACSATTSVEYCLGKDVDLPVDVLDQLVVGVRPAGVVRAVEVPQVVRPGVPLVPPGRDVEQGRLVRAQVLLAVAVEVLADQPRLVARVVQDRGDRVLVLERREAVGLLVGVDVVVVGVLPAQEARPRRGAQRVRRERVLEQSPRSWNSRRMLGMNRRSSARMSSVSITSMFGRVGAAAAAAGRGEIGVSRGSEPVVVACDPDEGAS